MSDLQIALIAIGVLVVVGVLIFNWYQERRFRERVERAFVPPARDALLDKGSAEADREPAPDHRPSPPDDAPRLEPRMHAEAPVPDADARIEPAASRAVEPGPAATAPERLEIDYVCTIEAERPISQDAFAEFLKRAATVGRHVSCSAWDGDQQAWVVLPASTAPPVRGARLCLQLADRSGAANRVQLASFRDLAQQFAEEAGGACICPDIDAAAERAAELDRFCAEVDLSVGFNVVAASADGIRGSKLRGVAEACGFRLEPDGRFLLRGEGDVVLFALESRDGNALDAEGLSRATLKALTLVMDVPRVPGGIAQLDRMHEYGRRLSTTLGGALVDDNGAPLTPAGVDKIRTQLRSVYAAMAQCGIEPGGQTARRLFS